MKCKSSLIIALMVAVLLTGCTSHTVDSPTSINKTVEPQLNLTAPPNANIGDFFLLTYIKPIFFTPTDYDGQVNFSKFDDLSDIKFFKDYTKKTGHKIDIYPGDFLREYEINNDMTKIFLSKPTYENAVKLSSQQKKTLAAYSVDLGNFIKSIDDSQDYLFMMRNGQILTKVQLKQMLTEMNDNLAYILAQIQIRDEVLNGTMGYSLPDVKRPELSEFETFAPNGVISKSTAKALYSLYTYYADDKDKTYKDSLTYSEDNFKLYKINLYCWEKDSGYVYGIDENVYPNVLLAERGMIKFDYEHLLEWDNGFTSCTCPFTDEERLNWYLVDDMVKKISKRKINSVSEYEQFFLDNPTQKNLELLAQVYRSQLYQDMKDSKKDNLAILWKRMNQIETKTYLYNTVMDDIDWNAHFAPFVVEGTKEDINNHYQQIISSDSFYSMTFMPWSSSVWFSPNPLTFDDGRTAEERAKMLPDNNFTVDDIDGFIRTESENLD